MKVILLKNVDNIGKKFEVKEVNDGYARNYLIPNRMAKVATASELNKLEVEIKKKAEKAEMDLAQTEETVSKLDGAEVMIEMKTTDEGKLYEAVNAKKIADELKKEGHNVKKSQVLLDKPIKEAGDYDVAIEFDFGLEARIKVIITGKQKEE